MGENVDIGGTESSDSSMFEEELPAEQQQINTCSVVPE